MAGPGGGRLQSGVRRRSSQDRHPAAGGARAWAFGPHQHYSGVHPSCRLLQVVVRVFPLALGGERTPSPPASCVLVQADTAGPHRPFKRRQLLETTALLTETHGDAISDDALRRGAGDTDVIPLCAKE